MKYFLLLLLTFAFTAYADEAEEADKKFHGYLKPFIHESMLEAIKINEAAPKKEEPKKAAVNDDKPKGFYPTMEFYKGAKYINIKADPDLIKQYETKGLDYREISYSPVRGQIQGSCWAEGAGSAFELNWNAVMLTKVIFSVQDIIDCSGFGTAKNGGQLSLEYALNGLAYESDYKYTGRDGRCNKTVDRHLPLQQVAVLRGENGGFPTEPELLTAFLTYGAMEVCGSASALGNGGRQDTIRSGVTNHCYAYGSAIPGKSKGWLDVWYHGIKNSWGDGQNTALNLSKGNWGDKGWGDYKLSNNGSKISGSVITEIMIGYAGPLVPPAPVTFFVSNDTWNLKVTVQPTAKYTVDKARATMELALKQMGKTVETAKPVVDLAIAMLEKGTK